MHTILCALCSINILWAREEKKERHRGLDFPHEREGKGSTFGSPHLIGLDDAEQHKPITYYPLVLFGSYSVVPSSMYMCIRVCMSVFLDRVML